MASATNAGFRLGIDFGTSHTTATLRWPNGAGGPEGHVRPLLFDGAPLLASAVYAQPDGSLLVGRDAVHAARLDPARFEPSPKRRIDRESVYLAKRDVSVAEMIAAVLGRVRDEAVRMSGSVVDDLTLTHPASWTGPRLGRLTEAARLAGLPEPVLLPEPVAAAGYFVSVLGRSIPSGSALVVYDFGGGTFDASAVTPADNGYRVLATAGLDNVGGVDLDSALLEFVATVHRGQNPAAWHRLEDPENPVDRRARRHLIEDVRAAKEMLSRAPSASIPVPLVELEARVSREEFDALARPLLDRTVATTADVIQAANLPPDRIAALLLVGGSSRIPLVVELLREATGLDPSTMEEPETVVAEGSIRLAPSIVGTTTVPVLAPTQAPTLIAPQWTSPEPAGVRRGVVVVPRRRRRRRLLVAAAVVLLLLSAAAVVAWRLDLLNGQGGTGGTGAQSKDYVRLTPPSWLPTSWSKVVDDEQDASVEAGAASNGGTCTYEGRGRLHVVRDTFDVSGCNSVPYIKSILVRDVAVEAELNVRQGCAGMWVRTSSRGYFLAVCADRTVRLHKLGDDPASDTNQLARTRTGFDPERVVVGLLLRGTTFSIYVDGAAQPTATDADIADGRLGIGGFAPAPQNVLDATIIQYRAWAPTGTSSG